MKKRLPIIIAVLLLVGCLTLCACEDGVSPVESIAVTNMPVTEYYRGDVFNLNNAAITVYYENGKAEIVPLDLSMISGFDSQTVGEQILTVKYGEAITYVRVEVSHALIQSIAVEEGNYRKTYVQGQSLNVNDMYLRINYANGFSEVIPITESMVSNFDTQTSGEKQLVIFYGEKTALCNITVVARSIANINVEVPTKTSYVVGDKLDFAGSRIFVAYNNNMQNYINTVDLLSDPNFTFYINGEQTDIFTAAGTMVYITVSYYGFESEFLVSVENIKATSVVLKTEPSTQPRNSAQPDLSAGSLLITYNNGSSETVSLNDERVTVNWREFDITRNGNYLISIECEGLTLDYTLRVVEPVEKELIIDIGDSVYYQDAPAIDVTQWTYRVLLTNGSYRAFADGATIAAVTESMVEGDADCSTAESGERTFVFRYYNNDRTRFIETSVTVTVREKLLVDVAQFEAPTRTVYYRGDTLSLTGGRFKIKFNDGSVGEWINLTADMLDGNPLSYTSTVKSNVPVTLTFTDEKYAGELKMSFDINVVKKAVSISYNEAMSEGLKTAYILGETFNTENLVVNVNYDDGTNATFTNFTGSEWNFENTVFNEVGKASVTLMYGDINSGALYAEIPVTVTNNVVSVKFDSAFSDFGTVVEGLDIEIPDNAILIVTRENGENNQVTVTANMLDYDKFDTTLGDRTVIVTYGDYALESKVSVLGRAILGVNILSLPHKSLYVISDSQWDLTGLLLRINFNNNTSLQVYGENMSLINTIDGKAYYQAKIAGRTIDFIFDKLNNEFADETAYNRQNVNFTVSDAAMPDNKIQDEFEIVCFRKLVNELFITLPNSKTAIDVFESEELVFPDGSILTVVFEGGEAEVVEINTLKEEEFSYDGFDSNSAGIQSVTAHYLLNTCTFTVNVISKKLESIEVNPEQVTVVEGNPIPANALDIRLHFLRGDNQEYDVPYYVDIELSNVNCTFLPNSAFIFDREENGVGYTIQEHTISYTYNGVTKSAPLTVRINRKVALSMTMQSYPKLTYIENESNLSLDNGSVLIMYNNGKSEQILLTSNNLRIVETEFDTSEIENGGERKQTIRVYFTDSNNIEVSTSFTITVKDRKYLQIDYQENPMDGNYRYEYGTGEERRPEFTLSGYLTLNGSPVTFATTEEILKGKLGYELYYLDEINQRIDSFPTERGVYTLVITYEGDEINNAFLDNSRRIEIYAKQLAVFAESKILTYGDAHDERETLYSWTVKGYSYFEGNVSYTDNPLRHGDTLNDVAEISYRIYDGEKREISFLTEGGKIVINAAAGTYEIMPYLSTMLSENYEIAQFVSSTLILQKKDIKIKATGAEKIYGDEDPRFNKFEVFDAKDSHIGTDGIISLGGGLFIDRIDQYTLWREVSENSENVGAHEILRGYTDYISNYNLISYTSAYLNIVPKEIVIVGSQSAERKYGQTVEGSAWKNEYAFALQDGSAMAWNESFEEIFGDLIDYKNGHENGNITVEVYLNGFKIRDLTPDKSDNIGTYRIRIKINDGTASNYNVTLEEFDFTITPMDVNVYVKSQVIAYSDKINEIEYGDGKSLMDGDYELVYGDGYVLQGVTPSLTLTKTTGLNVGRYEIGITSESITNNPNFSINLIGNFGDFIEQFFLDKPDVAALMEEIAEADKTKSYVVIIPAEFSFDFLKEETYARKTTMKPELTFNFGEKTFSEEIESGLANAVTFGFVNKTAGRAGYGYFTSDGYNGTVAYDYFANKYSRNFTTPYSDMSTQNLAAVYSYCFIGTESENAVIYSLEFDYTVSPQELDIRVTNGDVDYTGNIENITYSEGYKSLIHDGDSLNILLELTVTYYGRTEPVTAEIVREAGDYRATITDIGNYNYSLSDESRAWVQEFSVNTIILDVVIKNTENNQLKKKFTGSATNPMDNGWSKVPDGNDTIGYFTTTTHMIVNDTSLSATPQSMRIEPYEIDSNSEQVLPKNVGVYDFKWTVNTLYVNYSIRFVQLNPEWTVNSGGEKYIPAEYKYVIEPKDVYVSNLRNASTKQYDGKMPSITATNIVITEFATSDPVELKDLVFEFTRDMSKVPNELQDIISEDDLVSAGYFKMAARSTKTNNYNFILDVEHYVITRIQVSVTLNANNYSLNKQFDGTAPTAALSDLRLSSTDIKDEVNVELVTKHYYSGSGWTTPSDSYDAGKYAYDFRTFFEVGNDKVYTEFVDENTGNKLLSWNYAYYISGFLGLDSNNCDGVFEILPKDVYLSLPEANDELFDSGSGVAYHYIYYRTYSNRDIQKSDAQSEINNLYSVKDANGALLNANLGFIKQAMTLNGEDSIRDASRFFTVDYRAMTAANPNFNIRNNPIIYCIKQLPVELSLVYLNTQGNSEMDYGGRIFADGINYQNIDFADKAAFMTALGLTQTDISEWISANAADYGNNKFITSTMSYYLKQGDTLYNLSDNAVLNAGTYNSHASGIIAANFSFVIVGEEFKILPKEIKINGASRNYFDKESLDIEWSIDNPVSAMTERQLINSVRSLFTDNTKLTADAGTADSDGIYYITASRAAIEIIRQTYGNYMLNFTEAEPNNKQPNNIYLGLKIKKLTLDVTLKSSAGTDLSFNYGHVLVPANYSLVYTGLPELSTDGGYSYSEEIDKQNEVKNKVSAMINFDAIRDIIKVNSARDSAYTLSLSDYILAGASLELDNFELNLNQFNFTISKIRLILEMINKYADDDFRIVIGEQNSFVFAEGGTGRLNYSFRITNPGSIIVKEGENSMTSANTLREMLNRIWGNGNGTLPDNYNELVACTATTTTGSLALEAGENRLRLTDNWYNSTNYILECNPAKLIVYPEVNNIGLSSDNDLPFTAVSLSGVQEDYVNNIIQSLSMLVQLSYNGMPEALSEEWVDIKRDIALSNAAAYYIGGNYQRSWTVEFSEETPESLSVGDTVKLKLTFKESFFDGQVENTLVSGEFLVRIYGTADALIKDKTSSDFVTGESELSPFGDIKKTNRSYYLTNGKSITDSYLGKFDILGTDFILQANATANYSFEIILFDNSTSKLVLGFKGGADYGYYVRLNYGGGEQYVELKDYAITVSGDEEERVSVLNNVNVFDGGLHKLTVYIDKLGYLAQQGETTVYDMMYRVYFVIDDAYFYEIEYKGGLCTKTYNPEGNLITGITYENYIDFNTDAKTGFALNECAVYFRRFSLKTAGVSMAAGGFVQDVRLLPMSEGAIVYLTDNDALLDLIDPSTIFSNAGYEGKIRINTTWKRIFDGQVIGVTPTEEGMYRVTIDIVVNDIICYTEEILVCTLPRTGGKVTFVDADKNKYSIYADNPTEFDGTNGKLIFSENRQSAIEYSRITFNFRDASSLDVSSNTTFILKSTDNETVDLNNPATENYKGLSLVVGRSGTGANSVPTFNTTLNLRIGEFFWTRSYEGVEWQGDGNILEVRSDYVNGVIEIRLYRDNEIKFFTKIRKGFVSSPSIGADNVQELIGAKGNNGGYVGINMFRSVITMYEYIVTENKLNGVNLTTVADRTPVSEDEINGDVLLTDVHGIPLVTNTKSTYFRFSAPAGVNSFSLMFCNNTPYFFNGDVNSEVTGERGAFIYFTENGVDLGMYKYRTEWERQKISNINFLDDEEHIVVVQITDTVSDLEMGSYIVSGYNIIVYIDGFKYTNTVNGKVLYMPVNNDLNGIMTQNGTLGNSDYEPTRYGNLADSYFLPESRYVGIRKESGNAVINVKELFVF